MPVAPADGAGLPMADGTVDREPIVGWMLLPHDQRRFLYRTVCCDQFAVYQDQRTSNEEFTGLRPFDERRCIFIHIPKCAGISLATSLFGAPTGTHINATAA